MASIVAMASRAATWFTALLFALAAMTLVAYLWLGSGALNRFVYGTNQAQDQKPNPYAFFATNAAFNQASAAKAEGNLPEAVARYEAALVQAKQPLERSITEENLALALRDEGRYTDALPWLMKVGSVSSNPSRIRAYAIQDLVTTFSRFNDPAITQIIFSDPFYAGLVLPTDTVDVRYHKLSDYALTLYPLAVPALSSAGWYAAHLTDMPNDAATTTGRQNEIAARIQLAAIDMQRVAQLPGFDVTPILEQRALLSGQLYLLHQSALTTLLGDSPDALFKLALTVAGSSGVALYIRYEYADFLAKAYGATKAADIAEQLAIFNADATTSPIALFFKNTLSQKNSAPYADVARLAAIDPSFAAFLGSLRSP